MTSEQPWRHVERATFDPAECLDLPTSVGEETAHAALRPTATGGPLLVLTETGRALFCAHLAAGTPFMAWPSDFLTEVSANAACAQPPVSPRAWDFQLVNLLWRFQGWAFRRSDLDAAMRALATARTRHPHPEWFPRVDDDSDVIQHVNKSGQWGITHQSENLARPGDEKKVSYYFLRRPLAWDSKCRDNVRKRPGDPIRVWSPPACEHDADTAPEQLDLSLQAQRQRVLDYLTATWLRVPVTDWTLDGHRDPDNKNRGVVAQPKQYNRLSKSKWKFDDLGMIECPSVDHLVAKLDHFYPSELERQKLLVALQAVLGEQ